MNAASYAATERLRNGAALQIRALLPSDRDEMLAAVGRFSKQTLYRRFFAPKRSFSEREIEFFLNVDFTSHVALVAVLSEGGRQVIVGGATVCRLATGLCRGGVRDRRPASETGHCHAPDPPLDRNCARERARDIHRRSVAREHADA